MDEKTEKLIVRSLDGELCDEDQLELNRELIRNPQARRLMEEYRRIDALAGAALDQVLGEERKVFDPADLPPRLAAHQVARFNRGWWLVPGAVAAALLAIVIGRLPVGPTSHETAQGDWNNSNAQVPVVGQPVGPQGLMRTVGTRPSITRRTGREVLGVVGEDGNIYWIEVDRIRTIKRAKAGSRGRSWIEDM